jgi:hypothetical protein
MAYLPAGKVLAGWLYLIVATTGLVLLAVCAIGILLTLASSARRLAWTRITGILIGALFLALAALLPFTPMTLMAMRMDYALNAGVRQSVVEQLQKRIPPQVHEQFVGIELPAWVPSWRRGVVSSGGTVEMCRDNGGAVEIVFRYDHGFAGRGIVYRSDAAPPSWGEPIERLAPHWYLTYGDSGIL